MEGNTFFVIEKEHTPTGKLYAYAETVNNNYNLFGYFKPGKDFRIISINATKTRKEAERIAEAWNESAKAAGHSYLYN